MGDCELCGAMKVATRNVTMGRAQVQACNRCTEKMGLNEKIAPGLKQARSFQSTSSQNTGKRKKGKDIMSL